MEMSSFMDCKDIVKIISLNGDSIKIKIELAENVENLLDLLVKQNFIKDWYITDPEVIYEI